MNMSTILIVEDSSSLRELYRSCIESMGVTALVASDGYEGLRIYRERGNEIDMVLSDCRMPGMWGPEMVNEIEQLNPDVKVLYVTGSPGDLCDNHHPVMCKPVQMKDLQSAISCILEPQEVSNDS